MSNGEKLSGGQPPTAVKRTAISWLAILPALALSLGLTSSGCRPKVDSGDANRSGAINSGGSGDGAISGARGGQSDYRDPTDPPRAVRPAARDKSAANSADGSCYLCHAEIQALYEQHPMSGSIGIVGEDGSSEPTGEYLDRLDFSPRPDRKYVVEWREDEVLHHEQGVAPDGRVVYDQAERVEFSIGSGKRGRSYIINRDGLLFMSPISWYAKERRWDLSPSYDPARHVRFERPANDRCLQCHAGSLRYKGAPTSEPTQRYERNAFENVSIGCERCHGPGQRHVEKHLGNRPLTQETADQLANEKVAFTLDGDDTIVNPKRLDPRRQDDVCNQCHLGGEAQYLRYGRHHRDFRPGDHLGDVWSVFVSGTGVASDGSTKAVSHVGQMRSSKCYTGSGGKLVCTSCHDPHSVPPEQDRSAYFDRRCLKCHGGDDCAAPAATRAAPPAAGSCIHCHMPRLRADDVPHTTQTDHRIQRNSSDVSISSDSHNGKASQPDGKETDHPSTWRIFDQDESKLPAWEARRARGLLYAQLAEQYRDGELAREATRLLRSTVPIAPDDVDALDALGACARVLGDEDEAAARWEAVLRIEPNRQLPLYSLALMATERREFAKANDYFTRLTKVNPWQADVQGRHSMVLARLGRLDEAVEAAERARKLNPSVPQGARWLAELYRRQGRLEEAQKLESSFAAPASR